jgi:hypothetical protein
MKKTSKILLFCVATFLAQTASAQGSSDASPIPKVSDEWRFEVTPYLWGTGIRGTANLNNGSGQVC